MGQKERSSPGLFPGCWRYCGEYEGLTQPGAGYAYGKRLPNRESTKNARYSNPAAPAQRFPTTPTRNWSRKQPLRNTWAVTEGSEAPEGLRGPTLTPPTVAEATPRPRDARSDARLVEAGAGGGAARPAGRRRQKSRPSRCRPPRPAW